MNPLKRIILQSKPMLYTFMTILAINIIISLLPHLLLRTDTTNNFINLLTNFLMEKNTIFSPSSIIVSICFFLILFLGVQCIYLINNYFPMSLMMGSNRKLTAKHIFLFILLISIILSLIFNLTFIVSNLLISKTVIPYLLGYNWNTFDSLFLKLISSTLIFLTFSASIMWITSGFKVIGILRGLTRTRIVIALTLIISQFKLIKNYIEWGQKPLQIHIMLILVTSLTLFFTYRTLIRYELK